MEKTFEELIIEQFCEDGLIKMSFSRNDLIEMMQQVREATIEEILKLADKNFLNGSPKTNLITEIENLPTDRIKIKKAK